MRDLETLAADIDRFTLESLIPHTEQSKGKGGKTIVSTRWERVPADKGITALGNHIRVNWTIDEILFFKHFTHGGTFTPANGGASIQIAGYVAKTPEGTRNLISLFDSLVAEAWAFMGAALYAGMKPGEKNAALLCNSQDFSHDTLDALVRKLPPGIIAKIEEVINKPTKPGRTTVETPERRAYHNRLKKAFRMIDDYMANRKKWGVKGKLKYACQYACQHFGEEKDPKTGDVILKATGLMGLETVDEYTGAKRAKPVTPENLERYYRDPKLNPTYKKKSKSLNK